MAEDFSGFIISPQSYEGIYKLADTLNTQKAAREKAKAQEETNKNLLNKIVEDIDPKDYMTTTLEDGVITNKIYNLKQEASDFIDKNKGLTQNQLNGWLANKVRGIATASQNIKEIKRKADNAWEEIKTNPSADKDKFYKEWNRAFQNPDGTVREDIENIDPTFDYTSTILKHGDIWNNGAIYKSLEDAAKGAVAYKTKKLVRDASGKITTRGFDLAHSYFVAPKEDAKGIFSGEYEPANYRKAQDISGNILQVPKLDANGQPVIDPKTQKPIMEDQNLISDEHWSYFKDYNPETQPVIEAKLRKYGREHNIDPYSIEAQNAVRNELFNIVKTYPTRARTSILDETKAPVTINKFSMGGKGGIDATIRDIHTPAANLYDEMQDKKDQAIELIGQGKSDAEIGQALGLDKNSALIKNARQGIKKYSMPLNTKGLDAQFVNSIVDNVNKGQPQQEQKSRNDLYVEKNDNNEWEVKDFTTGDLIATIPPTTIGVGAEQGVKAKTRYIQKYKKGDKGATSQTYKTSDGKSYTHKQLIDMGYTDEQIQQALNSGTIKTK